MRCRENNVVINRTRSVQASINLMSKLSKANIREVNAPFAKPGKSQDEASMTSTVSSLETTTTTTVIPSSPSTESLTASETAEAEQEASDIISAAINDMSISGVQTHTCRVHGAYPCKAHVQLAVDSTTTAAPSVSPPTAPPAAGTASLLPHALPYTTPSAGDGVNTTTTSTTTTTTTTTVTTTQTGPSTPKTPILLEPDETISPCTPARRTTRAFAITKGRDVGVFDDDWILVSSLVSGIRGAVFKKYRNEPEAWNAYFAAERAGTVEYM